MNEYKKEYKDQHGDKKEYKKIASSASSQYSPTDGDITNCSRLPSPAIKKLPEATSSKAATHR